ncbi:anti-sigma factor [Pseudooceanicola pacificus]|nr:anti-sigma factor [Pseudooceanicola pacificus]
MSIPADTEDDRILAAEYILGLLDDETSRALEARMNVEPALRDSVAVWADDFAVMTDGIPEELPPPGVFVSISEVLFGTERAPSLLQRLGIVRMFVGAVAAAGLAFVVISSGLLGPANQPEFVARVEAQDSSLRFRAAYDADTGSLHLVRLAGQAAPGRSLEFWLIAGSNAPVSVMVWPTGADDERIVLPAPIAAGLPGGTLAISDEPEGGSPTGAPTGDVLAVGQVSPA